MTMPVAASVQARLDHGVATGALKPDPAQEQAAAALDRVLDGVRACQRGRKSSPLGWLFARRRDKAAAPRGLYLHGGVGRGKTMLMDFFFAAAPTVAKRRVHFNDFMADVHDRIGRQREARRAGLTATDDPIPPVAEQLAREAWVLCFDEFSVSDIADAMILSRLFSALFREGVVLVATSNLAPENLYRDGLNRGLFLPFIDILLRHCEVLALEGTRDHRQERLNTLPVYVAPLGPAADRAMDEAWAVATAGLVERSASVTVKGRQVVVPRAAGAAARFRFDDLCGRPLGARDFLALAERFSTFVIDRVPVMEESRRNEAKRFILLIDTLYDRHARIFISAEAAPDRLYVGRTGAESFEWARTASRLVEMQSAEWLEAWRDKRGTGEAQQVPRHEPAAPATEG
ncbi:MAG TPA: cell division protein ZapE [Mesorhizobium sp.]|jgi:cell division protein ZapE|nr:cell division protein ZapE [Mesorhizobium sp.]